MIRNVLMTRQLADCAELQDLVRARDIRIRPFPVLRLEDVEDARGWEAVLEAVPAGHEAWLMLASPRAARPFVDQARRRGAAHLLALRAASVGSTTALAARAAGLRVAVEGPGTGLGLAEVLAARLTRATDLVFACGHDRRPELGDALRAAGHRVHPVEVYIMRATPQPELPPLPPILDAVVLTSPRAARLYLEGVGGRPLPCRHLALGPTTRDAAAELGIDCRIPQRPDMSSLAEELCQELQV